VSQNLPRIEGINAGVVAGRDVDFHGRYVAGRDLYIYEGPAYPRLPYRREITGLLDYYLRVFVGREQDLTKLARTAQTEAPGYVLVEAPPGFGKSALLAQLVHLAEQSEWPTETTPRIVCFFVREEGRRNTPAAFCAAVNSQLLDLLGLPGGVPTDVEAFRSQLVALWGAAVAEASVDQPLLLLVDGLDEQDLGELTIAELLPGELGPYVHVIVAARPSPPVRMQVGWEHPARDAVVHELYRFGQAEVAEVLLAQGAPTQEARRLARRIRELTNGEPLYVRCVAEELKREGESALVALERDPPVEVRDYFTRQVKQLYTRVPGQLPWELLGVLLEAHGPISPAELAAVLGQPVWHVVQALEPLHRFLLGDERVEWMHQQLRSAVSDLLGPAERERARARLLDWLTSYARTDWPDATPDYAVAFSGSHLAEADDRQGLYGLVSRRWRDLTLEQSGSYLLFMRDVSLAAEAARNEDDLVQATRASLVRATVVSLAERLPAGLLGVLVACGLDEQAEHQAGLLRNREQRRRAQLEIAVAWRRQGRLDMADWMTNQVRAETGPRPDVLAEVGLGFAELGQVEQAMRVVRDIANDEPQMRAQTAVATALLMVGKIEQGLTLVRAIPDDEWRTFALLEVGDSLVEAEQANRALPVAEELLAAAHKRPHDSLWALMLAGAAWLLAQTGQVERAQPINEEAQTAARGSPDDPVHTVALGGVAMTLAEVGRFEQAVAVAREITEERWRASALAAVAEALAKAGQVDQAQAIAMDALVAVDAIVEGPSPSEFADAARALAKVGLTDQALRVAREITEERWRASALAAVAEALAKAGQVDQAQAIAEDALVAGYAVPEPWWAESAATAIRVLAKVGQQERARREAEDALAGARGIADGWARASALALLAGALTEIGHGDRANEIVEEALIAIFAPAAYGVRAQSILRVAVALAEKGHGDEAKAAAEEALKIARKISGEWRASDLAQGAAMLAEAGQIERALEVGHAIGENRWRAQALAEIVRALVKAGQIERAQAVAEDALAAGQAVIDGSLRVSALAWAAGALAIAGEMRRGLELVDEMAGDTDRLHALVGMAWALTKTGQVEQARTVAQDALAAAHATTDDTSRTSMLASVANAFAQAGQIEQALRVAREITNDQRRANALTSAAKALVRAGQVEQARAVAQDALAAAHATTDDTGRAYALAQTTLALADARRQEQARVVAEEALAAARAITEPTWRAGALAYAASVLARIGQGEEAQIVAQDALAAAHALADGQWRAYVLARVTQALAIAGPVEQAQAVADDTKAEADAAVNDSERAYASAWAGVALAVVEQVGQAREVVGGIGDAWWRTRALTWMVLALADAGHREQARLVAEDLLAAAHSIPEKSRASPLVDVAEALAHAGLGEQALTVAYQIDESYWRARALVLVAWRLSRIEQGDQTRLAIDKAVEAAREVRSDDGYAWAQARLAAALVEVEQIELARAAIHESVRAASRAGRVAVFDAMPVVAMILTCQDDESAGLLVQTVLEVDSWWTEGTDQMRLRPAEW
jgi:NACHT domain